MIVNNALWTRHWLTVHWLQVPEWILFHLRVLIYHCLNGTAPTYLADSSRYVADIEAMISTTIFAYWSRQLYCPDCLLISFGWPSIFHRHSSVILQFAIIHSWSTMLWLEFKTFFYLHLSRLGEMLYQWSFQWFLVCVNAPVMAKQGPLNLEAHRYSGHFPFIIDHH